MPLFFSSVLKCKSLLNTPRSLKELVICKFLSFKKTGHLQNFFRNLDCTIGVHLMKGAMAFHAFCMFFRVTTKKSSPLKILIERNILS